MTAATEHVEAVAVESLTKLVRALPSEHLPALRSLMVEIRSAIGDVLSARSPRKEADRLYYQADLAALLVEREQIDRWCGKANEEAP